MTYTMFAGKPTSHPIGPDLVKEQKIDLTCDAICKLLKSSKTDADTLRTKKNFKIIDGLLYKQIKDELVTPATGETFALVVPKSLVGDVLFDVHDNSTHPGRTRTNMLVRKNYWWRHYTSDIRDYIKSCDQCQRRKFRVAAKAPLVSVALELRKEFPNPGPFELVAMDLGNFARPSGRYRYFIVAVCMVTRFAVAAPLLHGNSNEIANFLKKRVGEFGTPRLVLTDGGRNLAAPAVADLLKEHMIEHRRSSPYHPCSNV